MHKKINIYDELSVKGMYAAGKIAALTLDAARAFLKENPYRKTIDIDRICHETIISCNAIPECIGYHPSGMRTPYKHTSCISVNDVMCHGVPDEYMLKDGDIVNIDIVVRYGDWLGDTSFSIGIGTISDIDAKLIEVAQNAMYTGMRMVQKFRPFNTIGYAVEKFCKNQKQNNEIFISIAQYSGHGISQTMHEGPYVEHIKNQCTIPMQPYHYFTIEPIVMIGNNASNYVESDGWTVRSKNGKKSLQFEHTMGLDAQNNLMIFTTRDENHEAEILKILFGDNWQQRFRGKRE